MDSMYWITVAVAVLIVLVIYRYGQEIGLKFKGWGVEAGVSAKGSAGGVKKADPAYGRKVVIHGDANRNKIRTGDKKANDSASVVGRDIIIGGKAEHNTIVTGDG
jgi:hypothetical protein